MRILFRIRIYANLTFHSVVTLFFLYLGVKLPSLITKITLDTNPLIDRSYFRKTGIKRD